MHIQFASIYSVNETAICLNKGNGMTELKEKSKTNYLQLKTP